jgi:hypothetical protein
VVVIFDPQQCCGPTGEEKIQVLGNGVFIRLCWADGGGILVDREVVGT